MIIEINSDISYLGKDIKKWVLENAETDLVADDLKWSYFDENNDRKHEPNPNAYYFVSSCRDYRGIPRRELFRDGDKSPRKRPV